MATKYEELLDESTDTGDEPAGDEPAGDEPAGDEPAGDEPAEPAEPAQAAAPQVGPDEIRKLERAAASFRKRVNEILGAGAIAHDCLLCGGLGGTPDPFQLGTTFTVVDDNGQPGLLIQPPLTELGYKHAPDKQTCEACDGLGQVLSGSKTEHGRLVMCVPCGGQGWTTKVQVQAPPPAIDQAGIAAMIQAGASVDAWGRPTGHPHFGLAPSQVGLATS